MRRAFLPLALLLAGACASAGGTIPAPPGRSTPVAPETAIEFHRRAASFYPRLIQRRFNTLETFNDPILRAHFRSPDRFFDYYADLAESLSAAHFEKSRPKSVGVEEFVFEDADRVRVQVRFVGDDNRPLRPNEVVLIRLDRWERTEGRWWIAPGKL